MYRTIDGAFWTDPNVKKLSTADKLLFLYFITNPVARVSGIYCIAIPTICYETKMSDKHVRKGIDTLSEGGFIEYDPDCEVVWVRNMLRHQAGNNGISPKIAVAVAKDLSKAHKSILIKQFLAHYHTLEIPYTYPIDSGAHTEDRIPKTESDTEDENGDTAIAACPPVSPPTVSTPFESLVDQWNTVCGAAGLAQVRSISDTRKAKMRTRWAQDGFRDGFPDALRIIATNDFLRGINGGWCATFDWVIENDRNWLKVVEGNYGTSSNSPPPTAADAIAQHNWDRLHG